MEYKKEKINSINGEDIYSITIINNNNFKINFYTYGGYIHEVHIPLLNQEDKSEDVLLGYGNMEGVLESNGYFNSIIGRVANRIGSSKFNIGNNEYEFLSISENEMHIRIIQTEPSGATLAWYQKFATINPNDEDGDCNGDTGEVGSGNNDVLIWAEEFETDGAPCAGIWNYDLGGNGWGNEEAQFYTNLTNHNYWNFHGHGDKYQNNEDHIVQVNSKSICESNEQSITTGKLLEVEGTKYNLQNNFLINDTFLKSGGIDHNYVLQDQSMKEPAAIIYSKKTGLGVEYFTNQYGIQFYTGNIFI